MRVTGIRKPASTVPSLTSIYLALAEHGKGHAYPEAIEAARADFATLASQGHPV